MAAEEIICGVCGSSNDQDAERCKSCGARLIELAQELSDEERHARRYQQDEFHWKWVGISAGVMILAALLAFGLFPRIISAYDPQGFAGIVLVIAMWFATGAVVNFVSPYKTFLEPPLGGLIAALPAMFLLSNIADVYQLSMLAYLIGALMAIMMALMGAFVGNRIKEAKLSAAVVASLKSARPRR